MDQPAKRIVEKVEIPIGTKLEIKVSVTPEFAVPKFANLVTALYSKDRAEVIIDFIYFDERRRSETGEVPGHPVAKIMLTPDTASNLITMLKDLLGK